MLELEATVAAGFRTAGPALSRPELVLAGPCPRSRRQRWLISLLKRSVARRLPGVPIRCAALDRGFPSIAEVMYAAASPSVVVPLWLSSAPALSRTLARSVVLSRSPVRVTSPLGPDPLLAEAISQRLRAGGAQARDTLLLTAPVEPGSEGHEDVMRAARLLGARWGGRPVHVGVGNDPHSVLPPLLASLQRGGARVAVAPYALMPGPWVDRCQSLVSACDVAAISEPLVHHALVAELVARRYEMVTSCARSAA